MKAIFLAIVICAALIGVEKLGERRGQKWADDWHAGSPRVEPAEPKIHLSGPTASVALLRMPKDDTLHERAFHRKHERIIEQHKQLLIQAGRVTDGNFMAESFLGTYGWYNGICDESSDEKPSPCSFGAYAFSQAAFEQAKKIFILRGQVEGGSDLLIDVGSGAFDASAVGYNVGPMTYCQLTGGKLHHCGWGDKDSTFSGAKVVEFIDKHTVRLDKKARWDAEMNGLTVMPLDYVDMCHCTMPAMPALETQ